MMSRRLVFCVVVASLFAAGDHCQAGSWDITGIWKGSWISDVNGHNGPMRARIQQVDAYHYDAVFWGRFAKVIPFRYKATLAVAGHSEQGTILTSSKRLPLLGEFHMRATVSQNRFQATYQAKRDHGRFSFSR